MVNTKALVIGALVIGGVVLFSKTTLAKTLGLSKGTALPNSQTGTRATANNTSSGLGDFLGGLLKSLAPKPGTSGGGVGFGGSPSGAGGAGTAQPKGNTTSPVQGNFGSYVVNGQLYDANGNALDENGRKIADVFDNSGLGPAGAGIDANGNLASNPLLFNDPSSAMYGIPALSPSYQTSGFLPSSAPSNPDLIQSAGDQLLADADRSASIAPLDASPLQIPADTLWTTGPGGPSLAVLPPTLDSWPIDAGTFTAPDSSLPVLSTDSSWWNAPSVATLVDPTIPGPDASTPFQSDDFPPADTAALDPNADTGDTFASTDGGPGIDWSNYSGDYQNFWQDAYDMSGDTSAVG